MPFSHIILVQYLLAQGLGACVFSGVEPNTLAHNKSSTNNLITFTSLLFIEIDNGFPLEYDLTLKFQIAPAVVQFNWGCANCQFYSPMLVVLAGLQTVLILNAMNA